jgi:hypothetical protein
MRIYVAEVHWEWDKPHIEYATMAIEEHEPGGIVVKDMEDPACSEQDKQFYFERFKKIAAIQNGNYQGGARLAVIYRALLNPLEEERSYGKDITFRLKAVFRFDENGENPILVP